MQRAALLTARVAQLCIPRGETFRSTFVAPAFYILLLTNEKGAAFYCACLSFWEPQVDGYSIKCLCLLSRLRLASVYRTILCALYESYVRSGGGAEDESLSGRALARAMAAVASRIPAPPPGGTSVNVRWTNGGVRIERWPERLGITQAPLHLVALLRRLGAAQVITVITALLCQHQVIFIGSSLALLSDSADAVLTLLYPFRYQNVCIPILSKALLDVVQAPTPFLLGVHSAFLVELDETRSDSRDASGDAGRSPARSTDRRMPYHIGDAIVVDLDERYVHVPDTAVMPMFPEPFYGLLRRQVSLRACGQRAVPPSVAAAYARVRRACAMQLLELLEPDLAFADDAFFAGSASTDVAVVSMAIRLLFVDYFACLMHAFRDFATFVRVHPHPVLSFQRDAFEAYVKHAMPECASFIVQLVESMAFADFVMRYGVPFRQLDLFDARLALLLGHQFQSDAPFASLVPTVQKVAGSGMQISVKHADSIVAGLLATVAERRMLNATAALQAAQQLLQLAASSFREVHEVDLSDVLAPTDAAARVAVSGGGSLADVSPDQLPHSATRLNVTLAADRVIEEVVPGVEHCLLGSSAALATLHDAALDMCSAAVVTGAATLTEPAVSASAPFVAGAASAPAADAERVAGRTRSRLASQTAAVLGTHAISAQPVCAVTDSDAPPADVDMARGAIESADACLNALFQDRLNEAAKFVPSLRRLFAHSYVREHFAAELRRYRSTRQLQLGQYELLLVLLNSLLQADCDGDDKRVAARLLPLLSHFFVDMNGVPEFLYYGTRAQPIWRDIGFWTMAFFAYIEEQHAQNYKCRTVGDIARRLAAWGSLAPAEQDGCAAVECTMIYTSLNFFVNHIVWCTGHDNPEVGRFIDAVGDMSGLHSDQLMELITMAEKVASLDAPTATHLSQRHHLQDRLQLDDASAAHPPELLAHELIVHVVPNVIALPCCDSDPPAPAHGTLFVTNYRLFIRARLLHTSSFAWNGPEVVHSIAMASLYKTRKTAPESQLEFGIVLPEGLLIRTRTFQALHVCLRDGRVLDVDALNRLLWRNAIGIRAAQFALHNEPLTSSRLLEVHPASGTRREPQAAHLQRSSTDLPTRISSLLAVKRTDTEHQTRLLVPRPVRRAESSQTLRFPSTSARLMRALGSMQSHSNGGTSAVDDSRQSKLTAASPTASQDGSVLPGARAMQSVDISDPSSVMLWDTLRLGVRCDEIGSRWRVSTCNTAYDVCKTYPPLLVVPRRLSDANVREVARFYRLGRMPILSWYARDTETVLLRSAAPHSARYALAAVRCVADERLFRAIVRGIAHGRHSTAGDADVSAALGTGSRLYVLSDALPETASRASLPLDRVATTMPCFTSGQLALQAPDCVVLPHYPRVEFLHFRRRVVDDGQGIRSAYAQLYLACQVRNDEAKFLYSLEQSGWLAGIAELLDMAGLVADLLYMQHASVLVSFGDGMDAVAQVCSLAQVLIDPFYRTMEGFRVLIQKEWLAAGYPFAARAGQAPDVNERVPQRAPVFLQFLDAVYQLLQQFPLSFEFK